METSGWNSPLRYIAILLIFLTTSSKGSECEPPSSPQCFRRNNEATVYDCEWHMNTTQRDVTFDLHFSSDIMFENIQETRKEINEEELIKYKRVEIWVEAQVGDSVCTSTSTSAVLNETVKFEVPQNISVAWFQNHLNVTWKAPEKYPALADVWFRLDETKLWEQRLNTTQFTHSNKRYHVLVKNLQKRTSYQLKLRHRTKVTRNPLWSDWSPLIIVPAELEDKLEVNVTVKKLKGARNVTLVWKPVPRVAAVPEVNYILRDTQSSGGCPCVKTHPSVRTEYTDYVSYAPVNFSVTATNAAGSSPTAIVRIPAEPTHDLKPCNKTLLDKKLNKTTCLEWYKDQDGDLRLVARKIKRNMKGFRNSIEDYVGYVYFEHLCINERPKTVQMCRFYKNENVPKTAPQDLFPYDETHSSASLSWKAIPAEDTRGFLTHYNVCSLQINSGVEHKQCHSVPASSVEDHLVNLTPATKYNITVAGVTRAGEGPKATVTFSTHPMNAMKGWLKLGLVMGFLFTFLLIVCTCVWKRMKTKILPPVPKPVVWQFDSHRSLNGVKLEENDEVVQDVTLQLL
ncbi:leukemia inhibitory factor receptor [Syngnathoides biaculeatus]|uniref:leukemia inhibitory factor receptor n=1 Tax=Syngnathoides biaculeatus TaxID=300417 RepID=UPI002ADDA8CE|nr:leukemia inhibitory factor receptor [Syngnathoides biaculeatus]